MLQEKGPRPRGPFAARWAAFAVRWPMFRVVIVLLAMVGMGATLLPWFHTQTHGPVPGTVGVGWVTFGLFLAIMLVQLAAIAHESIQPRSGLLTSGLAGGAVTWAGVYWVQVSVLIANPSSVGTGVYVAFGTAVCVFIASLTSDKMSDLVTEIT